MLNKIRYRLVYNRKHRLNRYGAALVQVEALQGRKKAYFTTKVYVSPDQWQDGHVVHHPNDTGLNAILVADITSLEAIEIELWKRGIEPSIETTQIYADVMNETMLKDVSRVKQQPQQLRLFPNKRNRKEE